MCTVTGFMSGLDPMFHSENFMLFTFVLNRIVVTRDKLLLLAKDQKRYTAREHKKEMTPISTHLDKLLKR